MSERGEGSRRRPGMPVRWVMPVFGLELVLGDGFGLGTLALSELSDVFFCCLSFIVLFLIHF